MKSFSFLFASVVLFLLTCSYDHQIAPDNEDMGGVKISVKLGPIGSLGKKMSIEFDALTLTLTAPGEDSVIAVIAISDTNQQTVTKTFSNLASLKTWTVSAVAKDKAGKTTHSGTTTFEIQPHGTTAVTLNLAAQYSMLKARFFPIRDSVNEVRLWVDGAIIADSSFGRIALCGDTVKLSDDYLSASPSGIQHAIRMDARGIVWGDDTLLYRGDTNITVVSGINASYAIKLRWVGPKVPPPGSATMTVVLGATGMVTMNGEMEDELNNEIKEIFAVNQEASLKIQEWLKSGSINEAKDKLVQFLNTKENVKKITVAEDGSVVSVEYMNGLEAVALLGKPGTLSYPGSNTGITVSVSVNTTGQPGGWVYRDGERTDVYNRVSSITMNELHDTSFTLHKLLHFGQYGFIHIASHGEIYPADLQPFFLSGQKAQDTTQPDDWNGFYQDEYNWWTQKRIFPDMVSMKWAVRPAFIEMCDVFDSSLVILSSCKSMAKDAMHSAFTAKSAKSVVGWDGTPDMAFAREGIHELMVQLVDSARAVGEACHNVNVIMSARHVGVKDSLKVAEVGTMQLPPITFIKTLGGNGGNSVQQTNDGGYIVVGDSLIKTNAKGIELWAKPISGNSVQQTVDGGYIVTGSIPNPSTNGTDISLIKTDANGNVSWAKDFRPAYWQDIGHSVQQTSDGGYIIAAEVGNPNYRQIQGLLIKTDANGNELWRHDCAHLAFGFSVAYSVQQTSDGGFIIAGYWIEKLTLSTYSDHVFLEKTDISGNTLWAEQLDSNSWGFSIQQTRDGGYIVAGERNDGTLLKKIDASGNVSWTKTFGAPYESGSSVQQTNDKGYIIVGSSLIKTDEAGNAIWTKPYSGSSVQQTKDGGYVVVGSSLIKTDENGNVR